MTKEEPVDEEVLGEEVLEEDALSEDTSAIQYITLARIYDVLMGIYTHMDKEAAVDLLEQHKSGNILGPIPHMNGIFITDEINE